MTCARCAMVNVAGSALCARCGAPLTPSEPASNPPPGYPPPGYPPPGYPPPGYYPPQPGYYPQQVRTSGMAIAGFVLSLVFCGILGLIFSIMGHNEVKRGNGMVTGGGLAIAGIVIGIIRLLIEVIYIVAVIVVASNGHY